MFDSWFTTFLTLGGLVAVGFVVYCYRQTTKRDQQREQEGAQALDALLRTLRPTLHDFYNVLGGLIDNFERLERPSETQMAQWQSDVLKTLRGWIDESAIWRETAFEELVSGNLKTVQERLESIAQYLKELETASPEHTIQKLRHIQNDIRTVTTMKGGWIPQKVPAAA